MGKILSYLKKKKLSSQEVAFISLSNYVKKSDDFVDNFVSLLTSIELNKQKDFKENKEVLKYCKIYNENLDLIKKAILLINNLDCIEDSFKKGINNFVKENSFELNLNFFNNFGDFLNFLNNVNDNLTLFYELINQIIKESSEFKEKKNKNFRKSG